MTDANNKYYIKLTAVTPLSVGAGNEEEWVKCADYVIKDKKVYILDMRKIADGGIDILKLTNFFLQSNHDGIVNLLGGRIEEMSSRVFNLPCYTENNIKAMERSQLHDVPLVAGSSIKGAIRSILFDYLREREEREKDVFGEMKDGSEFMRFIKIGDVEVTDSALYNTKIFNLHGYGNNWEGGWKHAFRDGTSSSFKSSGFNTIYECISTGGSGVGSLMISPLLYDFLLRANKKVVYTNKKSEIVHGGLTKLFAIINAHTANYLKKEKAFFEKYPAERSSEIIDCIDKLMDMIPADNSSCLIKMSAGAGFHSITGDWQYADYVNTGMHTNGKKKYKSRKIVEAEDGLALMGFVLISQTEEADYQRSIAAIESVCEKHLQNRIRKMREDEAAEELQRLADKKIVEEYDNIIKEAENHEDAGKYSDALSKALDAKALYPSGSKHSEIIERCIPKAEAEKEKMEEQSFIESFIESANKFMGMQLWNDALTQLEKARNNAEKNDYKHDEINELISICKAKIKDKDSEPLAKKLEGKTSIGNIAGTTKKWVSNNEFTSSELDALISIIKALPDKEKKNLTKKKKDFEKAIGTEWTNRLWERLGL